MSDVKEQELASILREIKDLDAKEIESSLAAKQKAIRQTKSLIATLEGPVNRATDVMLKVSRNSVILMAAPPFIFC